jgi:hypothetical protein
MTRFELIFKEKSFPIARNSIIDFLEKHPVEFGHQRYEVKSDVAPGVFNAFVQSLLTGQSMAVTKTNLHDVDLLAGEFHLDSLSASCSLLQSQSNIIAAFEAQNTKFDGLFATINARLSKLDAAVDEMRTSLESLGQASFASSWSIRTGGSVSRPFNESAPWNGVISYLTEKCRNVHMNGIVRVTSKSISANPSFDWRHVVDLASESCFWSGSGQSQWVCWDFRKLRVMPTHYTVRSEDLQSWVLEGSLNKKAWTELDRQTNVETPQGSFQIPNPGRYRRIRLTQTGRNRFGESDLVIVAVEFFGELSERSE